MVEALHSVDEGAKVGWNLLEDIIFAEDQGMIAETEQGLQDIMNRLHYVSKEYAIKINARKTKGKRVSKQGGGNVNIVLNEERSKQVAQFCYLGSLMTDNGSCSKEIKERIAMAKKLSTGRKNCSPRVLGVK